MSNSQQAQKANATYLTDKSLITSLYMKLQQLDQPNSLSDIIRRREITFREEFKRFEYTYSTMVEFKHNGMYSKYRLCLINQKLYIIDLPKHNGSSNDSKLSDSMRATFNYQYLNGYNIRFPKLSLNFDLVTAKLIVDKSKNILTILILGTDKKFKIRIRESKEIFERIAKLINQSIATSLGNASNLFGVVYRSEEFFKYNYISHSEFVSKCKTGDLLIFRGLECPSPLQRFFTGDEYDHVALIKKTAGYIYIYESTALQKCNLLSWHSFTYSLFNLVYDKIVYRRLLYDTSDEKQSKETQERLEKAANEFINDTKKKEYVIALGSIICWSKPKEYERKNEWKKAKGFFCSSLLAGAYYKMGVLEMTKSCRCILPGHFSQKDNTTLKFCDGFSFGPEEIIEFSI